jgi:hypothetical protein
MKHFIETNVEFKNAVDVEAIYKVLGRKVEASLFGADVVVTAPKGKNLTVMVVGNGALLRDACFALDVAGMLD